MAGDADEEAPRVNEEERQVQGGKYDCPPRGEDEETEAVADRVRGVVVVSGTVSGTRSGSDSRIEPRDEPRGDTALDDGKEEQEAHEDGVAPADVGVLELAL